MMLDFVCSCPSSGLCILKHDHVVLFCLCRPFTSVCSFFLCIFRTKVKLLSLFMSVSSKRRHSCRPSVERKKKHKGNWPKCAEWLFGIPCMVFSLSLVHCAPSSDSLASSFHPHLPFLFPLGTVVRCNTLKSNVLNMRIRSLECEYENLNRSIRMYVSCRAIYIYVYLYSTLQTHASLENQNILELCTRL